MAKAIGIVFVLFLCSVLFVLMQLSLRSRPRADAAALAPAPLLDTRPDGTIYAVSLEMDNFRRRLEEEQKRTVRLFEELAAQRKEREAIAAQLKELATEVRRLRRQMAEPRPAENPSNPPSAVPPAGTPGAGTVVTPE